MAEPEHIAELGIYVSSLRFPEVPPDWLKLVNELKIDDKAWIQIVDAAAVAGLPHILLSIFNVVSAHRKGYNKLVRPEVELLLVLSGTDRFQRALEIVGAKIGKPGIAVVVAYEKEVCASIAKRITTSIAGCVGISDPTLEEARDAARLQGLDISSLSTLGSKQEVQAILGALIERGSLLYTQS
jgi:tRNA threonylcarbamoyladenosine modification (KEOPS) complex Cgi121 subunit